MQRKGFHFLGLLYPCIYYFLLNVYIMGQPVGSKAYYSLFHVFTLVIQQLACWIVGFLTFTGIGFEISTKLIPAARAFLVKVLLVLMHNSFQYSTWGP